MCVWCDACIGMYVCVCICVHTCVHVHVYMLVYSMMHALKFVIHDYFHAGAVRSLSVQLISVCDSDLYFQMLASLATMAGLQTHTVGRS